MCGRFSLKATTEDVAAALEAEAPVDMPASQARYNIAPTQPVLIARIAGTGVRELTFAVWGLIPSWSRDPSMGARLINARSETAHEKPAFRNSLKRRRCLVPADGFYEWQKQGPRKQPFCFQMRHGGPFSFGGLWEIWNGPAGEQIESCTILTTGPNELMRPVHDRMPVIVAPADYALWLDPRMQEPARLAPLFRPYPAAEMRAVRVSTAVNNPSHDAPDCMEPLAD